MENATMTRTFSEPHGLTKRCVEPLMTITAESGMVCPQSGEWEIIGLEIGRAHV